MRWTVHNTVAGDPGYVSVSERYVLFHTIDADVLGFRSETGELVPWLTSRSPGGEVSFALSANGPLRVERTGGGTSVEQLDDDSGIVWSYSHPTPGYVCNAGDHQHLYVCADDGRTVTALDRDTGVEEWTVGTPDGSIYAGETADSLVLAGDGTLSVIDVVTGRRRWQRQTGEMRRYLLPVGERYVYAIEDDVVAAYSLDQGDPVWRMPLPPLEDNTIIRLTVMDGRLLLTDWHWMAALG